MSNKIWKTYKLGDLCNFVNGDAYKPSDWSKEGVPIIRIQNLNDPTKHFNYWTGSISNKVIVENGNILLAWSGTPGTSFGAHTWNRGKAVLNQHIFRVDFKDNKINPDFFVYTVNYYLDFLINKAHGGVGLRHVTKSEVEKMEVSIPPIETQRQIVFVLNKKAAEVKTLKQKTEKQLEDIKALRAACVRKVFSPVGEKLPEKWKWVRLKEICIPDKRIVVPNSEESKKLSFIGLENIEKNSGRILINGDVSSFENGISSAFYFDTRHVLYGKLRPYLNKVALPDFSGRCSTELIPLIPKDISREYLALILRQQSIVDAVMKEKTGARMPRASIEILLNQLVPFPPKEVQEEIMKLLNNKIEISYQIEHSVVEQLELFRELSKAYIQQAFRGELV